MPGIIDEMDAFLASQGRKATPSKPSSILDEMDAFLAGQRQAKSPDIVRTDIPTVGDLQMGDAADYEATMAAFNKPSRLKSAAGAAAQGLAALPAAIPTAIGAMQEGAKAGLVPTLMTLSHGVAFFSRKYEELGGPGIDIEANPAIQAGRKIREKVAEAAPIAKEYQEEFLTTTLPNAAAALLGFIGGALVMGPAGVAVLGSATEAASQLESAKAARATDATALTAFGLGAIIGTSEAIPIADFLKRADLLTGGSVKAVLLGTAKRGAVQGLEEGLQESAQQIASNATARALYDENRPVLDTVGQSGAAGGILGFLVGAIGGRIRDHRAKLADRVMDKPAIAERIAAQEQPSRDDFAGTGMGGERINAADRAAVAAELRNRASRAIPDGTEFDPRTLPPDTQPLTLAENQPPNQERTVNLEEGQTEAQGQAQAGLLGADEPTAAAPGSAPGQLAVELRQQGRVGEAAGVVAMDDLASAARRGLDRAVALGKRLFRSRGNLPSEAFAAFNKARGELNAIIKQGQFAANDLRGAAQKTFGRKLTEPERQQIDAVLKGEDGPHTLPEAIQEPVAKMRNMVDDLSRRLIDVGAIEGKLAGKVDENLGFYLNRSYQAFDDPEWSHKVPEDVRNRAKSVIRSALESEAEETGIEVSEGQVEQAIERLLFEHKAADTPFGVLTRERIGDKDLSILQKRKLDDAPEIRALLGEYKDPFVNYSRSVAKMAQLLANHKFLAESRAAGEGKWLFAEGDPRVTAEHKVRITEPNDWSMTPVAGMFTSPEIRDAFKRLREVQVLPWFLRYYMKANSATKLAKTVLSHVTHLRNFQSNGFFNLLQGHWKLWNLWGGIGKAIDNLRDPKSPAAREAVVDLHRYGIIDDSVGAEDVARSLADAGLRRSGINEVLGGPVAKAVGAASDVAKKLYQAEDNPAKIYAWEVEKRRYRKAFPDWTDEQVKRHAAEIIVNTLPTYSRAPEITKQLRRLPAGADAFVTFGAEVIRVAYNTMELIGTELRNPATRSFAFDRIVGSMLVATLGDAASSAMQYIWGIASSTLKAMRRYLPFWSENSQLLPIGTNQRGQHRVIDISYLDPFNYIRKPIIALMNGEDWSSALGASIQEAFRPFIGEQILGQSIIDTLRNTKKTGGSVYNPQDTAANQVTAIAKHIGEAFVPGSITSANRVVKAVKGTVEPSGRAYDLGTELFANLAGARVQTIDPKRSLFYKAKEFNRGLSESSSLVGQVASQRGTVADEQLMEAKNRTDAARTALFTEMMKDIGAAKELGLSEDEIIESLLAAGVGKRNAAALLDGEIVPFVPSKQSLRSRVKQSAVFNEPGSADVDEYIRRQELLLDAGKE